MEDQNSIKVAFYGDDFTGSTDALEFLTRAGAKTVLFLENPTPELVASFKGLDAIGIAGLTRAMEPTEMADTLIEAFSSLKKLQPRHVHYKVCSTFDSSPEIGNIGTAIECGEQIFSNRLTPVLVAAPNLGRYSAFGNLYARMGIGSQGHIFRLDLHPSMRRHPITPANESDLRIHLSKQTNQPMGLVDLVDLNGSIDDIHTKLDSQVQLGKKIVFFDAMYENQMQTIGNVIDNRVEDEKPLFSVGSSGIEKALGDFWAKKGILTERKNWRELTESKPMLVLSGSVSPVSAAQIEWAVKNGFTEIGLDVSILDNEEKQDDYIHQYSRKITNLLKQGESVIFHTSKGPDDPRYREAKAIFKMKGWDEKRIRTNTAKRFGSILGKSARLALEHISIKRLVISGGDTSSYVARELGIKAVEMIAPIYLGAPVCKAFAPGSPIDQMEVNLKGGQVGDVSYFGELQQGKKGIC